MKTLVKASLLTLLLSAGFAQASTELISNGGFETNNLSNNNNGYAYAGLVTADAWSFLGGAGVSLNNTAWGANTPAPSTAFAFLQNTASISQTFTTATASNFTVAFDLAERTNFGTTGQVVGVSLDGKAISQFDVSAANGWAAESFGALNVGAGVHTLTFTGLNPKNESDTTGFIDNVSVIAAPVPEPETYAMMLAGLGLLGFVSRRRKAQ